MNEIKALQLNEWRQFHAVELDLSKQVTVITGQNGCGKTTLLNLINRHFGWNLSFVSTPYISKRRTKKLWSDFYRPQKIKKEEKNGKLNETDADNEADDVDDYAQGNQVIGVIKYNNGVDCTIVSNKIVGAQYQPEFRNIQSVSGLHIPSHRPIASYTHVNQIPTDPRTATQEYQSFQQLLMQFSLGAGNQNPGKIQKQSLISFAVFGEGNNAVTSNPEIKKTFDDFQKVLRTLMPKTIGFKKIEIRMPEVVLVTESGDFTLDAMSGGVNAIFSIAWQIHMFAQNASNFTVTIDEPENHLHPSMQRTLLPNLAKAFPNAKFIVSTHSPFMVSSFPEANIYALLRNDQSRIVSQHLDVADVSGTPNEVLREILDVDSNLPVWVEDTIARVIEETADLEPSAKARLIMDKLEELGIADSIVEYKSRLPNAEND